MSELHDQLKALLRQRRIQLNVIASNPRQGGTMLLLCMGCAQLAEGCTAIGLLNEPGNLGVLPGCHWQASANPRREADMDRLLLLATHVALLGRRLEEQARAGGCEEGWIKEHRTLVQRLQAPRVSGSDGQYDPSGDAVLLADVQALQQRLDRQQSTDAAVERPPLILTLKEHNYNRNQAEFLRLLALVQDTDGTLLFSTRRPDDCFESFLLRRTVHFLCADGTATNREIAKVVSQLLLPSDADNGVLSMRMENLRHYATRGFSNSGDRIDLDRLRAFVGKSPGAMLNGADLQSAGKTLWDHCMSIIQMSYANTERYLQLAHERLPAATQLVDFNALLDAPDATLRGLAQKIPWIQCFRTNHWGADRLRNFFNFPEAFVLPGSGIERNVWFKDTLAATGIRPREHRGNGNLLRQRDPEAAAALDQAYQRICAAGASGFRTG